MFDGLQTRKHAAIGQIDRMITEARMNLVRKLLDAFFEAAISRGDPYFRLRHQALLYNQRCLRNVV